MMTFKRQQPQRPAYCRENQVFFLTPAGILKGSVISCRFRLPEGLLKDVTSFSVQGMKKPTKDNSRLMAPVMSGVVLAALAYASEQYLQPWATALVCLAGAAAAEIICRMVFDTGFLGPLFADLFAVSSARKKVDGRA
ncbi:MAG: hypothetical protein HGB36_11540 [Chlorobiaceae bacterium]|nr:hypothetical protein [Chlorobiaceae bacterium]